MRRLAMLMLRLTPKQPVWVFSCLGLHHTQRLKNVDWSYTSDVRMIKDSRTIPIAWTHCLCFLVVFFLSCREFTREKASKKARIANLQNYCLTPNLRCTLYVCMHACKLCILYSLSELLEIVCSFCQSRDCLLDGDCASISAPPLLGGAAQYSRNTLLVSTSLLSSRIFPLFLICFLINPNPVFSSQTLFWHQNMLLVRTLSYTLEGCAGTDLPS